MMFSYRLKRLLLKKRMWNKMRILAGIFFVPLSLFATELEHPQAPQLDPGLKNVKDGMRAFQSHYTNYHLYTMNIYTPGYIEIGVYNENVNNKIETVPFYRWRAGPFEETNGELDFAIEAESKGFFVIQLPFGIAYTRDGRFQRDKNNRLIMLGGGYPVFGQNGEIFLPPGKVTVTPSGAIFVNGDFIDKMQIAVFEDRSPLVTLNGNIFYVDGGEPKLLVGEQFYKVRQGHLENSNVLKAITGDIMIARNSYEANARAAKMLTKLIGSSIQMANP